MRGTHARLMGILVLATAGILQSAGTSFSAASTSAAPRRGGPPGTIGTLPRVLTGLEPQAAAFDPATRTVYVPDQFGNMVSVINARRCNARATGGCRGTAPAFAAGSGPFGVGVDPATHTVYVADGNTDTVKVFNAATCNGGDRRMRPRGHGDGRTGTGQRCSGPGNRHRLCDQHRPGHEW